MTQVVLEGHVAEAYQELQMAVVAYVEGGKRLRAGDTWSLDPIVLRYERAMDALADAMETDAEQGVLA